MAATKKSVQFRVRAFAKGRTPQAAQFCIHDSIRGLIKRDRGDSSGSLRETNSGDPNSGGPTQFELGGVLVNILSANSYTGQPAFAYLSPLLGYIEFGGVTAEGANASQANGGAGIGIAGLGGFYLRPNVYGLNCKMKVEEGSEAQTSSSPRGDADAESLVFIHKKPALGLGIESDFETVRSFDSKVTQIQYSGALPNRTAEVHSETKLAKNQQFRIPLRFIQRLQSHDTTAGIRMAWGRIWSIVARENKAREVVFSLERYESKSGTWETLRTFEEAKLAKFEGEAVVSIERIAGRLVIGINQRKFDFVLTRETPGPKGQNKKEKKYEVVEMNWESAPLKISLFGVRVRFGFEKLLCLYRLIDIPEYAAAIANFPDSVKKEKIPMLGYFSRIIKMRSAHGEYEHEISAVGWNGGGKMEIPYVEVGEGEVRYECYLEAPSDGITSPFLSTVVGKFNLSDEVVPDLGLDVTSAFLSGDMEEADPEANENGVTMQARFSRNLLNTIDLENSEGLSWRNHITQFGSLIFEVRYLLSDGSYSPWSGRFFYIIDENLSTRGANEFEGSVTLHDPMIRLSKPHSTIDHRFLRDLGWLMTQGGDKEVGKKLYGGDLVKYLLSVELDEAEAQKLNGDGNPIKFFAEGHAPFIDPNADRMGYITSPGSPNIPTQGSPIWPVDWNSSVQSEIQKVARLEFGMFFYDFIPVTEGGEEQGPNSLPVPIYADYRQWVANMPTYDLYDSDGYTEGDVDFIMTAIEVMRRGDAAYNRVLAWATPKESAASNLPVPAVFMAESRLPSSDPNSMENTGWWRTFVKEDARLAYLPNSEAVAAFAAMYLSRLRGIQIEWPTVTLRRGDMRLRWGTKVRLHMSNNGLQGRYSDASLGLDGRLYRVLKARHNFSKERIGPDSFTTTLSLFPILNGEAE